MNRYLLILPLLLVTMSPIETKPPPGPGSQQPQSSPPPSCFSYQRLTVMNGQWICVEIDRKRQ